MGLIERDPYTGHSTTGHEWNGIKELNSAVPWPVWAFLIVTAAFSLVWWILYPAWPLGTTHTKGLLGDDVRQEVASNLRKASESRSVWMKRIETQGYAAIQKDPVLMQRIRETGHALFGDNCAACHGVRARGGPGYPSLVDKAWIWGGSPEAIFQTIAVGVNSTSPDTRVSQMPAWGRDGMIDRTAVANVVAYVYSLRRAEKHGPADHPGAASLNAGNLNAGKKVFMENCVSCHGANARGTVENGAPDLTDGVWLYGGSKAAIHATVYGGAQGHMPAWAGRLTAVDRKILTLYILDLGRRTP